MCCQNFSPEIELGTMNDEHRDSVKLPGEQKFSGKTQDELNAWLAWLQQLTALGTALSALASAEIRLAGGDLRRLLLIVLLLFPVIIFTWLGLSVCISWFVYSVSGFAGAGFFAFFVLQASAAVYIRVLIKRYRRSLTMPMTRKYLAEILEDIKHGP